jgi:glycine oxidase
VRAVSAGGDVVVIGAGLIGLGIAHELAARGAAVVVLDAREAARGASWAGAGMLAPDTEAVAPDAFLQLCRNSLLAYPAYVERLRAETGVDAHLRLDGILHVALGDDAPLRARAHGGAATAWLDRPHALEPSLAACVRGALQMRGEGHVDNRRLGRALRAACERRGVRLVEGQRSVAVEADRRIRGVRANGGFIPARAAVNAAGAWAADVDGVPAEARARVTPVKGQMLALAVPRGFIRHAVWFDDGYVVPRDDGRLLVGATVEHAGFDERVTAGGQHALLAAALAAFPALRTMTVSESWAGLRPATADGLPYLGASCVDGYFLATGHYRNGILLVPATASALADLIEGKPRADLQAFRPDRHGAGTEATA